MYIAASVPKFSSRNSALYTGLRLKITPSAATMAISAKTINRNMEPHVRRDA